MFDGLNLESNLSLPWRHIWILIRYLNSYGSTTIPENFSCTCALVLPNSLFSYTQKEYFFMCTCGNHKWNHDPFLIMSNCLWWRFQTSVFIGFKHKAFAFWVNKHETFYPNIRMRYLTHTSTWDGKSSRIWKKDALMICAIPQI